MTQKNQEPVTIAELEEKSRDRGIVDGQRWVAKSE